MGQGEKHSESPVILSRLQGTAVAGRMPRCLRLLNREEALQSLQTMFGDDLLVPHVQSTTGNRANPFEAH